MPFSRSTLGLIFAASTLIPAAASAQAQLLSTGAIPNVGGGLGSVTTILTLNNTNNVSSGCITPIAKACTGYPDNMVQTSSTVRSLAEVGGAAGTLGTDLRIIANFSEPGSDAATVSGLSLYLYNATGTTAIKVADLNTATEFAVTNPGVGNAGFGFGLNAAGVSAFNAAVATLTAAGGTPSTIFIGIGASLTNVQGGLDTFFVGRLNSSNPNTVVPEPSTYALMAAGLAGVLLVSRRRRNA
ncbi:MAG: PEP-CTERM sorting domain-containing protein [Gemmatimonadota bacterium]